MVEVVVMRGQQFYSANVVSMGKDDGGWSETLIREEFPVSYIPSDTD